MKTNSKLLLLAGIAALCSCTSSPKNAEAEKAVSGSENQVVETILARRSVRKYKQQPVEKDKLQQILECGINAPNGMGRQSWEIRVVDTPELLAEIDSLNTKLAVAKVWMHQRFVRLHMGHRFWYLLQMTRHMICRRLIADFLEKI